MIEELKKHLLSEGKTDSWLNLAIQFNILPNGTNKQRSDKVRRIFNNLPNLNYVASSSIQTEPYARFDSTQAVFRTTSTTYKDGTIIATYNDFPNDISKANSLRDSYGNMLGSFYDPSTDLKVNTDWANFKKWEKTKLPESKKTNGIHILLSCVHVPYHNKELIVKLASFIQDNKSKIVGFHLIGDYLDLKSLSSHDEKTIDKSGWTLKREYEAGNLILDMFDSILPKNIDKTFIYGNHEDRYFRYISNIKNYKTGDAIPSPTEALKLNQRGYRVYDDWKEDCIQIGKYQVFHGIYCTTNSTKSHVDKLRHSCIFGHTHRIGEHFEGSLHGLNIGCLADLNSEGFKYLSRIERQTWNNAFGIVNVHDNFSQAELVVCNDNSFFYAGKKY